MSVLSVSNNSYNAAAVAAAAVKKADTETAQKTAETTTVRQPDKDTFVRSGSSEQTVKADTETKRLDADQIRSLQDQISQRFSNTINDILNNQANQAKKAGYAKNGITKDLFSDLVVTPEQKLAAQQSIGEDGEWGVNAVAGRIIDMCVSLSGGDSSKISEMRAAVEKGFQQATGQWGGNLPSICSKTHDEINKRFDYWEKNGSMNGYQYQRADED